MVQLRTDYKAFERKTLHLKDYPGVARAVDPCNGIVYINLDAKPDANIIWYLGPYWDMSWGDG